MINDLWHFPRTTLAKQVVDLFQTGLASALVFFAPRRMGKTEFLCKDVQPYAEQQGWRVLYFSFLATGEEVQTTFINALTRFSEKKSGISRPLLSRIRKIGGTAAGISAQVELSRPSKPDKAHLQDLISQLINHGPILLLMDEVQTLAKHARNEQFIAELRTTLDIYKDHLKVIFTGSSQEGLRQMFSQAQAPFFHFGQHLPFPTFGREFTDHLAQIFKTVTRREIDSGSLWVAFQEMEKIPQLARALVERLALHPNQSIAELKQELLRDIFNDRAFVDIWRNASTLEQLLLQAIAKGTGALFSEGTRKRLAKQLGVGSLSVPSIQSSLRTLQRKNLVGRLMERSGYFIDDPNFKNWLLQTEAIHN